MAKQNSRRLNLRLILIVVTLVIPLNLFAQNINANAENLVYKIKSYFGFNDSKNLLLLGVKGYQQSEDYTCGPAIVMSLMHYYGMLPADQMNKTTELRIAKEMGTSHTDGTSTQQMVDWLRKNGFTVQQGENGTIPMLINNLKNKTPVIVEWIDWGGHWVIVSGYNKKGKTVEENQDTIFLADPSAIYDHVRSAKGVITFNAHRFFNMWLSGQSLESNHLVKGLYIVATPKK